MKLLRNGILSLYRLTSCDQPSVKRVFEFLIFDRLILLPKTWKWHLQVISSAPVPKTHPIIIMGVNDASDGTVNFD